jgi:hypothetical protein
MFLLSKHTKLHQNHKNQENSEIKNKINITADEIAPFDFISHSSNKKISPETQSQRNI